MPCKKTILTLLILIASLVVYPTEQADRWWHVYFTQPAQKEKHLREDNPERALVRLIDGARLSFYGAFYDISAKNVEDALIRAKHRGVDVKIVTESDNYDRAAITGMIRAGIPVVIDRRKGLMHNKFAIIDGRIVWTGSYNCTDNDARMNNNNSIEIHSPALALCYSEEFREMFDDAMFGNRDEQCFPLWFCNSHQVTVDGNMILLYFSPDDGVEEIIGRLLSDAQESICFMAFSFTSDLLGDIIIERYENGVSVSGIIEKTGSMTRHSEYVKMKTAGINVVLDKNPRLMHHKVIIIDNRIVIVGSFNFSRNADERNDENILIIYNSDIAAQYLAEFARLVH